MSHSPPPDLVAMLHALRRPAALMGDDGSAHGNAAFDTLSETHRRDRAGWRETMLPSGWRPAMPP